MRVQVAGADYARADRKGLLLANALAELLGYWNLSVGGSTWSLGSSSKLLGYSVLQMLQQRQEGLDRVVAAAVARDVARLEREADRLAKERKREEEAACPALGDVHTDIDDHAQNEQGQQGEARAQGVDGAGVRVAIESEDRDLTPWRGESRVDKPAGHEIVLINSVQFI